MEFHFFWKEGFSKTSGLITPWGRIPFERSIICWLHFLPMSRNNSWVHAILWGASITLSISDDQIYLGNTVTLTWTTSNASSCTASGSWSGSKALSGSETLTPDSEGQKNYTLTCSNSAGTSTSRTVSTNVIGNSQGVVVGANYISSPTVILDINSNYQSDDGEPSSSADSSGVFELLMTLKILFLLVVLIIHLELT